MGQQGVQHSQVGVAQGGGGQRQVEQVAGDDVEEDAQVVGVEVLVRGRGGEEEVEQLEDQQLQRGFALPVQQQDDVLAEGLVARAVRGQGFDDSVREGAGGCGWGLGGRGWVVGGDHVLFVEDELGKGGG